jgi:hypothetical protein
MVYCSIVQERVVVNVRRARALGSDRLKHRLYGGRSRNVEYELFLWIFLSRVTLY